MKSSSVYRMHGMREPRKNSGLLALYAKTPAWVRALAAWVWSVAVFWVVTKLTMNRPWFDAELLMIALIAGTAFAAVAHTYRRKHPF